MGYVDEAFYTGKSDEIESQKEEGIERMGKIPEGIGYHPMKFTPPKIISLFAKMPKGRVCNTFNGEIIQKCGLSIQEIGFVQCEEGVSKN